MATGTDAGGTWNTTAGNKTVVATPAVGDLIVVVHGMSDWASGDGNAITDNNADGLGASYHRIGGTTTAVPPGSTGGGTACALWISIRNSLIGSATSTTFTATISGDTGGGLTVLRFSGMTRAGSRAIRQFKGESTQTESPPSIAFANATLTANPVVIAVIGEDNPLALTNPTGFTTADATGYATPTTGITVVWGDSGNTASTYAFTGGAVTDHNEVAIELDTSAAVIKDMIRSAGFVPARR